jgi:hypothetical protein
MNARSRLYLATLAYRHLAIAMLLWLDPERYQQSATFEVLFYYVSARQWAAVLMAISVTALAGAWLQRQIMCRVACVAAVFLGSAWSVAFVIASAQDQRASWLLAVVFIGIAAKDFIVAGAPYSLESLADIDVRPRLR